MYDPNFEKGNHEESINRFKRDEKRHKIKISLNHSKAKIKQDQKSQLTSEELLDENLTPNESKKLESYATVNTLEAAEKDKHSPIALNPFYSPRAGDDLP